MNLEQRIGQKLLLAFECKDRLTPDISSAFQKYLPGGISLFRPFNMDDPAQLRALTDSFHGLARDLGVKQVLKESSCALFLQGRLHSTAHRQEALNSIVGKCE